MNVDMNQLPSLLATVEKLVAECEQQQRQQQRQKGGLLLGASSYADAKVAADRNTKILRTYLSVFINGPTDNNFEMAPLADNRQAATTSILGLYDVVNPNPFYTLQMKALEWVMSKLPYDIDLSDDPDYIGLVSGLLNNRQPVTEVDDFGTLQEFLSKEGSFWLQPISEDTYAIDLTRYGKYEVRQGYSKYGGRAEVDGQLNIVSIDGVDLSDPGFGLALSMFKSTLVLDIILHCHAILSHLLVSQKLYMTASTTYYEKISADPVLRDLYYLCTYRTNEINSNIPVLAGSQGSLIQMGFGFTSDAFLQMMSDLMTDPALQTPPDIKAFLITSRGPQWKRIAEPVYAVVDKFVERTVGVKLPEDIKLQTKVSLFVSTFYHEMVGDFQLKTIYNCDLNTRTYLPKEYDRRTAEFAYIIAAATMGVSVRILKLKQLVKGTYLNGESLAAWTELYNGLKSALAPFEWIDVDNFEFSVGY